MWVKVLCYGTRHLATLPDYFAYTTFDFLRVRYDSKAELLGAS
ncbi:MAG: hypothetical protein WBO35_03085 [Candidatus Saccharimonadales bacterium]